MLARIKQGSTWAAIAAACGTLSVNAPTGAQPYLWGLAAFSTLLGVLLAS